MSFNVRMLRTLKQVPVPSDENCMGRSNVEGVGRVLFLRGESRRIVEDGFRISREIKTTYDYAALTGKSS